MGPNHGGGHFPTSSSGVTPVAPIWWAPPVGEHAPAPCALMPPAPPWPRTSRLRTPSARTLASTGTAPAPHPSAPSTPRPAPSRHPPRPMPCHVPHAVASIVRTSPCACAHLPTRGACLHHAPRRRVDCARIARRLRPLAAPMCVPPRAVASIVDASLDACAHLPPRCACPTFRHPREHTELSASHS